MPPAKLKTLLITSGSWYLPNTAVAFESQGALAGLWMSDRNKNRIPKAKFKWCWPVFVLTKPLWFTPLRGYWAERLFWDSLPVWRGWLRQQRFPPCDVVHARMGYALEPFTRFQSSQTLKVLDCANSHPTTQRGYWQRELDLFAPGLKPVVPDFMFRRMNQEIALADVLLCPSEFVRQTMIDNGVTAEKCFVCPFGFDTERFTPRDNIPEHPRFIFTGTISLRKGVQYLWRAFAQVKKQIPSATLVLVGGVSYDCRKEAQRWQGTFEHVPFCNAARLAAELRAATAYVFPSCEEGFARSLIEAMGCALPVIASNESGATTLIQDKISGWIIRPNDVDALAKAMQLAATNPSLNQEMGLKAYNLVKNRSWAQYGQQLLEHYQMRRSQQTGGQSKNVGEQAHLQVGDHSVVKALPTRGFSRALLCSCS